MKKRQKKKDLKNSLFITIENADHSEILVRGVTCPKRSLKKGFNQVLVDMIPDPKFADMDLLMSSSLYWLVISIFSGERLAHDIHFENDKIVKGKFQIGLQLRRT